ncbi:MAG: NAD-dependent epimerase/dehydratase family protein [Candidatus Zixiibacteriota bacterium]
MIKGKTIFITGGAGFIGSALAERLVENNRIIIFDNFRRNSLQDKPHLASHPNVELIRGDVRDRDALAASIDSANIVIHAAAVAGVDSVLRDPVMTMEVNVIGTYNVYTTCLEASSSLERVIDFSTSEVFGAYAYKVTEENLRPALTVGEARWSYAISKLTGEFFANSFYIKYGMPICCVRPFNIYGPGQVGEGAIHHFVVNAIQDKDLTIYSDGSQIRAWCYIDDILDALLEILQNNRASGHAFNIGNPKSTMTIYHLAREIVRVSGSKSQIVFKKANSPDVEIRIPDINKAREILSFEPKVELEDGLLRTIAWYREKMSHGVQRRTSELTFKESRIHA